MPSRQHRSVALACLLASLAACEPHAAPSLSISGVVAYPPLVPGGSGVLYATFENRGDAALTITGFDSSSFRIVELHETVAIEGAMQMRAAGQVRLEPGESLRLRPGALHLMLSGPRHALATGDPGELTIRHDGAETRLHFEFADRLTDPEQQR